MKLIIYTVLFIKVFLTRAGLSHYGSSGAQSSVGPLLTTIPSFMPAVHWADFRMYHYVAMRHAACFYRLQNLSCTFFFFLMEILKRCGSLAPYQLCLIHDKVLGGSLQILEHFISRFPLQKCFLLPLEELGALLQKGAVLAEN